MRSEFEQVKLPVTAGAPAALTVDPAANDALERRLTAKLDESDRKSFDTVNQLWSDFHRIRTGYDQSLRRLTQEVEALKAAALERQGGGR
jgi:hypothetical protein